MTSVIESEDLTASASNQQRPWRTLLRSTPGRLGALSMLLVGLCVLTSAIAFNVFSQRRAALANVRDNAAPVMIATQRLSSSLAETDAAATGAFLSGLPEDKTQRQDYEDSLSFASRAIEHSARLIGNDPAAHEELASINAGIAVYAGLIESARTKRLADDKQAAVALTAASTYLTDRLKPQLDTLTADASTRLAANSASADRRAFSVVIPVLSLLLLALLAVQAYVAVRSRRLVNVALLLATLVIAGLVVWTGVADLRQRNDLRAARAASGAGVQQLSTIRGVAYRYESALNQLLIAGTLSTNQGDSVALASRPITAADITAARTGRIELPGLLGAVQSPSDSPTKRALISEMFVRWQRFADVAARINAETTATQRALVASQEGEGAFAGFNVTVDTLLAADEKALLSGISNAQHRSDHLPLALLVGPLAAGLLALLGLERRRSEYR